MSWQVLFHAEFEPEFNKFDLEIQDELLAHANLLKEFGPLLKRPAADTLKGSKHGNMKELRFTTTDRVWRVAFAFDPGQKAILLVAGDKSGVSQKRFYQRLIKTADARLDRHLAFLKAEAAKRKEAQSR